METVLSLSAAFIVLAAFAIWMALEAGKLRKQIADRDVLIDDLRSALGGVETREDWRNQTL